MSKVELRKKVKASSKRMKKLFGDEPIYSYIQTMGSTEQAVRMQRASAEAENRRTRFVFEAAAQREFIRGFQADVPASELSKLLKKQAVELRKKVKASSKRMKKLFGDEPIYSYIGSMGSTEQAVRMQRASAEAENRRTRLGEAARFDFMAKHLRPGEIYILSEADMARLGIGS